MVKNKFVLFCCALVLWSCDNTDDPGDIVFEKQTLATLVGQSIVEVDNVIACASGTEKADEIIAYLYPRPGATDIKYFETENAEADKNDYAAYTEVELVAEDFFNGYLKTFIRQTAQEKWVIISFRESGKVHLSNPIRLKHKTQQTDFSEAVTIQQDQVGMPLFSWYPIADPDNAIYFQVMSDEASNLLSGTYTFETQFRYYNLDNVVLNITRETPPDLISNANYGFTLMAVSEDNWVNALSRSSFNAQ